MSTLPPIKLRIKTKGLLFILVPLVLQIVLFIQLMHLTDESEQLVLEEQRLYVLAHLEFDFAFQLGYAYMSLLNRISGSGQNYKLDPEQFLHGMMAKTAQVRELRKLVRTPIRDVTPEVEAQTKEVYDLLLVPDSQMATTAVAVLPKLLASERRLDLSYRHLLQLKKMNDDSTAEINRIRENNALQRQNVKTELNVGIIIEILMTVFLLLVFLSDITKRLTLLVRNAQLLPTGENLPLRVTGNDELAYLDSVLHTASADLRKAAEHRQSITNMVAHDLRSPLASMKLALKLLLDEQPQDVRTTRVESLMRSVSRLTTLVENLLTFDKAQTSTLTVESELIDFAEIASGAIDTLNAKASEKNVKLENRVDKTLALGDAAKLEQVLTNLISNAIKYSPENKEVTVSCEKRPKEVVISVRDYGPGVPLEKQEEIFNKGVQVDPGTKSQGFGLGLTIARDIVKAHEGRIGVFSKPTEGATFWFSIPADNDPEEEV